MTSSSIQNVAVIGSGTMGHGIAQVCATSGIHVRVFDSDPRQLEKGRALASTSLEKLVTRNELTQESKTAAESRMEWLSDLGAAVAGASIVVEAIPENIALKQDLFRKIEPLLSDHAVLGTNTSSLSVSLIASSVTKRDRVIGLHFFNPVPIMKLLEIVRGKDTADSTVEVGRAFAQQIGKRSILVRDVPGFATSRLGVALGAEAIRMLEQGVASAEDIDLAMELGYRHPMGPLRLTDLVGLDVRLAILEHLYRELGETFRPPELLRKLVREGKLGRKTGEGFYRY